MLVAMLPAMAVRAYADDEVVELGSVWVVYEDVDNGNQIAEPTILHYEDLTDGQYSIAAKAIDGFFFAHTDEFVVRPSGTEKSHSRVTQSGHWSLTSLLDGNAIAGYLESEDDWAKFRVLYKTTKVDDGYLTIEGCNNTTSDTIFNDVCYYDDLVNGSFTVDLNRAGYTIARVQFKEGDTSYGVYPALFTDKVSYADGVVTGTLSQGDIRFLTAWYVPNTSIASFNSVLLLNENSTVPNATINYSITPGTGIAAVPGTSMAVLAPSADTGVTGTPTISNAVFAPGDATVTSVDGVTIDAGEKAVVKPISVDFSGVTFAQPGIFRYVINEPSSGNNMTYDTQMNDTTNGTRYQRVLDVYVIRNASDEYEIGGFVLHEVAGAVNEGETTAADKSSGFVNEYNTTGLTLECQVEGNQSSIDKYFAYTITMQNPGNSAFSVAADWSNASGAQNPVANPATSYTNEVITAANTNEWTSNADGSLSKTIYLKDGQKVALDGIPVGTAYSITVAEEDYGPSWVVGSDNGSNDATGNRTLNAVEDVVFTLTREGVVPTGVALSILPGVILMGAAAAFFFVMKNRKREETSEA